MGRHGKEGEKSAKVHGRTRGAESRIPSCRLREPEFVAPSNDADGVKAQLTEIVCGLAPSDAASTIAPLFTIAKIQAEYHTTNTLFLLPNCQCALSAIPFPELSTSLTHRIPWLSTPPFMYRLVCAPTQAYQIREPSNGDDSDILNRFVDYLFVQLLDRMVSGPGGPTAFKTSFLDISTARRRKVAFTAIKHNTLSTLDRNAFVPLTPSCDSGTSFQAITALSRIQSFVSRATTHRGS